jgi:hypothetical protein
MNDVIDWLNDNSGAVQAIVTCILVIVTAVYAYLTRSISRNAAKQAEASIKMAEEMRRSREDGPRPVLDIQQIEQDEFGVDDEAMLRAVTQLTHDDYVWCKLGSIGRGPALNIKTSLMNDRAITQSDLGTLGVNDETGLTCLAALQGDQGKYVCVEYADVYRRRFFSRRPVIFGENGPHLGPLETGEEQS